MGGSLSFTCNADSIHEPGKKSMITDAIPEVSPDAFFAGLERYVRDGKTAQGQESKFDKEDYEGGLLTSQVFEIPALLGGGAITVRSAWQFDAAARRIDITSYPTDVHWHRGAAATQAVIMVHDAPVRVEAWVDNLPVRSSGPVLEKMMSSMLEAIGSSARGHAEQPAMGDAGERSVVSDPIEDMAAPEAFWDLLRAFLCEQRGATELPDGSLVEERQSNLEWVAGVKTFVKHVYSREASHVYSYEYGDDESMTDLFAVTHLKIHRGPFRLEHWHEQVAGRRAGSMQLRLVEPIVKGALEVLQKGS